MFISLCQVHQAPLLSLTNLSLTVHFSIMVGGAWFFLLWQYFSLTLCFSSLNSLRISRAIYHEIGYIVRIVLFFLAVIPCVGPQDQVTFLHLVFVVHAYCCQFLANDMAFLLSLDLFTGLAYNNAFSIPSPPIS